MSLISIIIPTFNRGQEIKRAIKSVLAQSHQTWELVIIDDGSSDDTESVVRQFLCEKVKYFYQANDGVSSARNYGASLARGDYLIFLDSDDELRVNLIENLYSARFQKCDLIFWNLLKEGSEGSEIWKPKPLGPLYNNMEGIFLAGSVCFKKEVFEKVGGYDEKISFGENYELAMRITRLNSLTTKYINEVLVVQHIREKNRISNSIVNRLSSYEHLYEKHFKNFKKIPKENSKMNYLMGYVFEENGQTKEALGKYKESFISHPLNWKAFLKILYLSVCK